MSNKRRQTKEQLQAVMTAKRTPQSGDKPSANTKAHTPALKRTDSALQALANRRSRPASSEEILTLDSSNCLPSFVSDRMDVLDDPDFELLKSSIQEHGQKVPILVRPHPTDRDCYQVAYGHRRVRACRELGIAVKAVTQELTDEELVVAQGKENGERKGLSYIEQALFAQELRKDFTRETVRAALCVGANETAVSKMTKIVGVIPLSTIKLIGPAPKIGRPNWEKLAAFYSMGNLPKPVSSKLNILPQSEAWQKADSNDRFKLVLKLLQAGEGAASKTTSEKQTWENANGKKIVELIENNKEFKFSIPRKEGGAFAQYLRDQLPELLKQFEEKEGSKS